MRKEKEYICCDNVPGTRRRKQRTKLVVRTQKKVKGKQRINVHNTKYANKRLASSKAKLRSRAASHCSKMREGETEGKEIPTKQKNLDQSILFPKECKRVPEPLASAKIMNIMKRFIAFYKV